MGYPTNPKAKDLLARLAREEKRAKAREDKEKVS